LRRIERQIWAALKNRTAMTKNGATK